MENEITCNVKDFILGGNANFTIFQEKTEKRGEIQVKYHVKSNDNRTCYFISTELVSQPCSIDFKDGRNLLYQGYITSNDLYNFRVGKKGITDYNKQAVNALLWVLKYSENIPPVVHIYHHGKCSVCGRKLTDAMSLRCGIGPTCRKRVGV